MVAMINKLINFVSNHKNYIIIKIKERNKENNLVFKDSLMENKKRILCASFFEILLHIGVIALFVYSILNKSIVNYNWKTNIIICHSIFLIISFIVFITMKRTLSNNIKNITFIKLIQTFYFMFLLVIGVLLVGIVKENSKDIIPFVIASLSVGSFFIIRPSISFVLYALTYVIFVIMIIITIPGNGDHILHFANGLAIVIIGYAVSLIGWNNHRLNINQKKEIVRQNEMLEQMAYFDWLTNIPNRRFFDTIIEKEKAKIKRKKTISSIAILDIDHFKKINDNYGHSIGDLVLREIADTINSNIRKSDTVARLGGEEFIILFPDTNVNDCYKVLEELRLFIMKKDIIVGKKTINITASFGVSNLSEDDDKVYYADADQALYLAKNSGRNKVIKYEKKIRKKHLM